MSALEEDGPYIGSPEAIQELHEDVEYLLGLSPRERTEEIARRVRILREKYEDVIASMHAFSSKIEKATEALSAYAEKASKRN